MLEPFEKFLPKDQAAYQPGRSTTEQVFEYEVLAEKAILCSNIILYLGHCRQTSH